MSESGSTPFDESPSHEPPPSAPTLDGAAVTQSQPPKTIRQAVALMYAGAVLSAINLIVAIFAKSRIHDSYVKLNAEQAEKYKSGASKNKALSVADLDHAISQAWVISMISAAITIALWIVLAQTNKKGNKAARIVATVLCVLNVLLTVANLLGGFSVLTFVANIVMLAVAVGATYLLWSKPSSDYFAQVRAAKAG